MASGAVRLLEIQLETHKRSLHERARRIDELEARNIDLEAQVSHLQEVVATQQAQSNDATEPPGYLNHPTQKKRRESDRGPEPDSGVLETKRRRLSPQEVIQPRYSDSSHHFDNRHSTSVDVGDANGANDGASGSPVRQPDQPPRNIPQPPESAAPPGSSRGETLGSSPRNRRRVNPSKRSHPVEDPGAESDSSYQPEDDDDDLPVHATRRARAPSLNPAILARLASVEPFAHGVVAEKFLSSTAERQTLGRRLNCKGKGTIARSRVDGTELLFPARKQHPYAPAVQGAPGLFFSADLDAWMLEGEHEVCVGVGPGKFKYMGEYALEKMDALEPEEFKSLPRGTKTHWGTIIMKQKKYGAIRRRVFKKRVYGRSLDAQDIIRAFEEGDEKLFVWRMKCIGYDHELLSQATGLPLEVGHCTGI